MEVKVDQKDNLVTLIVEGRVDTTTAPDLEKSIQDNCKEDTNLVLDFTAVEYISSAALRVLLSTTKRLKEKGSMVIKNPNDVVMEIFEVTGFLDILTIER